MHTGCGRTDDLREMPLKSRSKDGTANSTSLPLSEYTTTLTTCTRRVKLLHNLIPKICNTRVKMCLCGFHDDQQSVRKKLKRIAIHDCARLKDLKLVTSQSGIFVLYK